MMLIGICGASGSGKSTLARELSKKVDHRVVLISQDAYYRDHAYLPLEERANINYDEPEVFEHDELLYDMKLLKEGKPITRKAYDYTQHCRADAGGEMIEPAEVVIVEGIHAFHDERLRDMMDLRIFVDVDPDVCLLRRVKRDIKDRGRDILSIYDQYLKTVKPMFEKHIRGYSKYADIIIPGGGKNSRINDILACNINAGALRSAAQRNQ